MHSLNGKDESQSPLSWGCVEKETPGLSWQELPGAMLAV